MLRSLSTAQLGCTKGVEELGDRLYQDSASLRWPIHQCSEVTNVAGEQVARTASKCGLEDRTILLHQRRRACQVGSVVNDVDVHQDRMEPIKCVRSLLAEVPQRFLAGKGARGDRPIGQRLKFDDQRGFAARVVGRRE